MERIHIGEEEVNDTWLHQRLLQSNTELWRILGRPLIKQDPDTLIYNERMSPVMIRRIIERDYTITPTMLSKLTAIAKEMKTDALQILWAIHRQAYIAGLGRANIEKAVNEYILRLTGNKKLLINIATINAFNERNNLTGWKPESPEKIAFEERGKVDEKAYPQFANMSISESAETNDLIFTGFEEGKSVDQIAKDIERTTGVTFEDARVIVRTESTSITNTLRLKRYQERDPHDEYRYIWEGPRDFRVTEICKAIKSRIQKEGKGKGVPLKVLLAIVEDESVKGNGPGWQYRTLLAHVACRHSLVRVV